MELEEEQLIRVPEPESMVSLIVGRAMTTLLTTRSKKLQDAINRLSPDSSKASLGSLDESLWFVHSFVRDAVEREATMDEILVPMIEHTLRSKESKHGGQAMVLLNWLFQDELLFEAVAKNLTEIIARKDDRYIALGWCILVRDLIEYDTAVNKYLVNGIRENYSALLKILCSCISHLSSIVHKRSTLQHGFELPSRLSLSAADCLLALTGALTRNALNQSNTKKSMHSKSLEQLVAPVPNSIKEKKVRPSQKSSETDYLLLNYVKELIYLVQSLHAWSRKSRPLHAKGLEQVLMWLQEFEKLYGGSRAEADSKLLKTGILLLSSCWKHYSMLLSLEDCKFSKCSNDLLNQYLSGVQYYTESHDDGALGNNKSGIETKKFFLSCLCLLLGRFDGKRFESIMSEYGSQLLKFLLSLLQYEDEDVRGRVICIFKTCIFRASCSPEGSLTNTRHMDSMLPLLFQLLDERDGTARAIVELVAEYCSISTNGHCITEVLERLAFGDVLQRKNSMDIISQVINITTESANMTVHITWQEIASRLLECLGDEETVIREQSTSLLLKIDPSLVVPTLVKLMNSSDDKAQSSAKDTLVGILNFHKENFEVICLLLDHLSNLSQGPDIPRSPGHIHKASKFEIDRVLALIPEWSKNVQNWSPLIEPLIDKMFKEPSNATMVRFLSCINEQVAEAADVVLNLILLHMKGQKDMNESLLSGCTSKTSDDSHEMQQALFERLCPLLILRLLPLRVFDNLDLLVMYGQPLTQGISSAKESRAIEIDQDCVAAFLLNRAFSKFEFEDVRKLAAELCGRIHPQVLFPIVGLHLEQSESSHDVLRIKSCLFAICTSLVVRRKDYASNSTLHFIGKTLEKILLWSSLDGDEVSKAQHGCIDCLALMICAELQGPRSFNGSTSGKSNFYGKNTNSGNDASISILTYAINNLVRDKSDILSTFFLGNEYPATEVPIPISFRICMANVLISASQKISDSGKKEFAQRTLPCLIRSVEAIAYPEVRAACIQALFSVVYYLKSTVLPYSSDLLKLCLKFLTKESTKERMAGAKLMASLLGSEDAMLESISGGLLEAKSLLSKISSTDPSPDVRQVCQKLLECLT